MLPWTRHALIAKSPGRVNAACYAYTTMFDYDSTSQQNIINCLLFGEGYKTTEMSQTYHFSSGIKGQTCAMCVIPFTCQRSIPDGRSSFERLDAYPNFANSVSSSFCRDTKIDDASPNYSVVNYHNFDAMTSGSVSDRLADSPRGDP